MRKKTNMRGTCLDSFRERKECCGAGYEILKTSTRKQNKRWLMAQLPCASLQLHFQTLILMAGRQSADWLELTHRLFFSFPLISRVLTSTEKATKSNGTHWNTFVFLVLFWKLTRSSQPSCIPFLHCHSMTRLPPKIGKVFILHGVLQSYKVSWIAALEHHNTPAATLVQSLPNKKIYVGIRSEPNDPFPILEMGGGTVCSFTSHSMQTTMGTTWERINNTSSSWRHERMLLCSKWSLWPHSSRVSRTEPLQREVDSERWLRWNLLSSLQELVTCNQRHLSRTV